MDDRTKGMYRKFAVRRTDGSSRKGGKHHGCGYFVLDMDHDPHIVSAIVAYAHSAGNGGYHLLAAELMSRLMKSPAYSAWHALKFKQLPPRLKKFLKDAARAEMDANRA